MKNTVERRKEILTRLMDQGQIFIPELSKEYLVSEVTIRNDLDQLEKRNQLIKVRGGAIKISQHVGTDPAITQKKEINIAQKERIGLAAAELIQNHDTVLIDSGSTTAQIVKHLDETQELTLLTNAINIANLAINLSNTNVIIPGGYLRKNSSSLVGPLAEENLRNFFVDKVFIGVDGFDTRSGLYTPNLEEGYLNKLMIEISKEVIVVCDSSKFKKKSLTFICNTEKIDKVITDQDIEPEDKLRLIDAGIDLIIV
ncbi:MAG: transcriptional repressor AgaR [Reichenbachiella sp.]|uniref:transcriptional repressor AgaR n=1 Tax=Reichenbachiella sp. TaxID=2184521 RepID=UPI003297114B